MKQIHSRQGHTCFQKPLRAERRPVVSACQVHRQPNAEKKNEHEVSRRLVLTSISILPSLSSWASAQAGEDSPAAAIESAASSVVTEEFDTLKDDILAYEFKYPVKIGDRHLPIIPSRKPERYSSAAPLSADARQRIVSELVSFQDRVTISVTVGPASGKLATKPLQDWTAREVANTVLQDRSTARVTTGQRVSLNTIEEAATETRDGHTYWAYEHTSQGSPSLANRSKETYRHSWSVTSHRPGLDGNPYLYTLTLSCPDEEWPQLGPLYAQAQQSFRLVDTTEEYVPPDKDPWRFF